MRTFIRGLRRLMTYKADRIRAYYAKYGIYEKDTVVPIKQVYMPPKGAA